METLLTPNEAMKVLIACEYSGRVRDAFIALGHDAMSCDILPTDSPGPHYQGSVLDVLNDGWDLMIAHPPCTYLTIAAEWAYKDEQKKKMKPGILIGAARRQAREEAIEFVMTLANAPIPRIAIENPIGVLSSRWRDPDQFIQPYEYGEDASKRTCLWLKGLPKLKPTQYVNPRWVCCGETLPDGVGRYGCPNCLGEKKALPRWGNQTNGGQNKEPPSADRWKIRSTTWQGWADAFASQWGRLSLSKNYRWRSEMYLMPHMAELAPIPRLIADEKPPIGTRIWLITRYGAGYAGIYNKHDTTVFAWCPLPKLTPEQKQRLAEMEEPVKPEPEPENPMGCAWKS